MAADPGTPGRTGAPRTTAPLPAFPVVIRLPRTTYLVVLFLLVGSLPLAFTRSGDSSESAVGPQTLVLLIPILAAILVARTATVVTEDGLRARLAFGSKMLPWSSLRGLSVDGRGIYAVQDAGRTRLPCVRLAHLGPLSRLSGGRLPELADAPAKPAPQRQRRR